MKEAAVSPGVTRFSIGHCLGALVLAYVSLPFVQHLRHGLFVESLFITLILLSAVLAVGRSRTVLAWSVCLALPALMVKWVHYVWPDPSLQKFYYVFAAVFCTFIVAQLFRFIFSAKRVDGEVLSAAIAAYLLIALVWSFGYSLVAEFVPGAFAFTMDAEPRQSMGSFTALYFSFSTLCTVGYGDIVPLSGIARMFAMSEASFGMFYMAMMISRLVSIYSAQAHDEKPLPPPSAAVKQ